jgi:DNA-directed RNA polymerase subunit M/transcription elongation factor TFIIS
MYGGIIMKIVDKDERARKGYDDLREFVCVCCGKKIMLTKFASAKTAKCSECKSAGKQIDPNLIPTQATKQKSEASGNTKTLPCTKCGTMVEVNKFMSAAKVLCDSCKGYGNSDSNGSIKLKVDVSKVNQDTMPSVEDYSVLPSNIANTRLRNVTCPACGEPHMRILNILDYSPLGLIIHYQCNKCKLLVSVSEQCRVRCKTQKMGHIYDYSGHAIEDLMGSIDSTRAHGVIDKLYNIVKEHNIEIEGIELPPYLYAEDKPVPVGFTIPRGDKDIKAIEDAIQLLSDLQAEEGEGNLHYNDMTNTISALKKLFTNEGNGDE